MTSYDQLSKDAAWKLSEGSAIDSYAQRDPFRLERRLGIVLWALLLVVLIGSGLS